MSQKYHIKPDGTVGVCKAERGGCPYQSAPHFESEQDAQDYINKQGEAKHSLLPQVEAENPFSLETLKRNFPEYSEWELSKLKTYYSLETTTFALVKELEDCSDKEKATDEYFDKVQRIRTVALTKYESRTIVEGFADMEKIDEYLDPYVPKKREWKKKDPNKKSTHNFHPEITPKNFDKGVGPVISAYTGKPLEKVKQEIEKIKSSKGISLQKATEEYWKSSKQRTDKAFVSLDLETANPQDRTASYDNGQLTYIIEIGAIKVHPDGKQESIDFTSGIPAKFYASHGTGFIEVHQIEYSEIENRTEFSQDEKKQKSVLDLLDNSVIIAHNANFDTKQLTNSLRGFKKKLNDGNIEVLDTMNFCKYLVPKSPRNTNEAFVETAGIKYENAHRAYSDARMTLDAFNILKK